jgi:hypothetical protein
MHSNASQDIARLTPAEAAWCDEDKDYRVGLRFIAISVAKEPHDN